MGFPRVSGIRSMDDWLIDIRFRGLKTGQVIYRRVAIGGRVPKETAIFVVLRNLKITDQSRIVSLEAKTRRQDWLEQGFKQCDPVQDMARYYAQRDPQGATHGQACIPVVR